MFFWEVIFSEIGLEKIIVNTLRRNYCSGWTLSAHICKNDQTCCYGQIHSYSNLTNAFNENDNIHSELENCKYFPVHSNKDEFIIKLTALKELVIVWNQNQSRMKLLRSWSCNFTLLGFWDSHSQTWTCPGP